MKFNQDTYIGPYNMTEHRNNGTGHALRGNATDTYNLRNIILLKNRNDFHCGAVCHRQM